MNDPTQAHPLLGFCQDSCFHVQQCSAVICKITRPLPVKFPAEDETEQGQLKPAIFSLDRRFNCVARGS